MERNPKSSPEYGRQSIAQHKGTDYSEERMCQQLRRWTKGGGWRSRSADSPRLEIKGPNRNPVLRQYEGIVAKKEPLVWTCVKQGWRADKRWKLEAFNHEAGQVKLATHCSDWGVTGFRAGLWKKVVVKIVEFHRDEDSEWDDEEIVAMKKAVDKSRELDKYWSRLFWNRDAPLSEWESIGG